MSLKKQFLKSKPICKVTFRLDAEACKEATKVQLLGDFNEWNTENAINMKSLKSGEFKTIVNLETGKDYEFKYLIDGETWENDWAADKYVPNGYGVDNSVVTV